ncbi:MAG TPA: hypothetical protein VMR73_01300 [Candidatus Paceibacterota bacterium]|nr:hypothetical protein [Candidatus Paceibacterota bacterium]
MKSRGIIKILVALTIAACLILLFLYFAQTYLSGGLFGTSTSTPSMTSVYAPQGVNPLLGFINGNGSQSSAGTSGVGSGTGSSLTNSATSPYAASINLGSGNASSDIQPEGEYITLSNNSQTSVDITGWTVENGADERAFQTTGNQAVNVAAKAVKIPQGTQFLSPSGNDVIGDIILKPGDSAVLTVGAPFISYPFPIAYSFRENICSGYFNYTYPFNPQISAQCPTAANEPDSASITDVCFNYVRYLPACYNPQVQDVNNFKNTLQQNCQDYITSHMNYPGCVAHHENDTNFSLPVWRIFLGQNQAMWRSQDDKIIILDTNGKTVSEIDY